MTSKAIESYVNRPPILATDSAPFPWARGSTPTLAMW
jgi:hypothetical protein